MENLVSLCHQRLNSTGPPVLLPSVKNRTGARTLQLSSTPKLCKVADGDAQHTTGLSCEQTNVSARDSSDDDEALPLHNPIAPSSSQDIAQQCKTRQRSRKMGDHLGCTDHAGTILEVPRMWGSGGRSWAELEIGLESSSAWPDAHQHRRKPINIEPRIHPINIEPRIQSETPAPIADHGPPATRSVHD